MPFGVVIRGCRDFAFIRHSLAAALTEGEKKPKSAVWPKCPCATHLGSVRVHLLVPAPSAKGVAEVRLRVWLSSRLSSTLTWLQALVSNLRTRGTVMQEKGAGVALCLCL